MAYKDFITQLDLEMDKLKFGKCSARYAKARKAKGKKARKKGQGNKAVYVSGAGFSHNTMDKVAKMLKYVSWPAFISLVNFVFGTTFPLNSQVIFLDADVVEPDTGLELIADLVVQILSLKFHLEFQMKDRVDLILRIIRRAMNHALASMSARGYTRSVDLDLPASAMICLKGNSKFAPISTIHEKSYSFNQPIDIKVIEINNYSLAQYCQPGLILLVPFQIMEHIGRVNRMARNGKLSAPSNIKKLQKELFYDIIDIIKQAAAQGHISPGGDGEVLANMTIELYKYHYGDKYAELAWEVKDMEEKWWGPVVDDTNKKVEETHKKVDDTNKKVDDTNKKVDDTNKKIDKIEEEIAEMKASINMLIEALIPGKSLKLPTTNISLSRH